MGNGGVWVSPARISPKTNFRLKPVGAASRVEEERRRAAEVRASLSTIHPNPGPPQSVEERRRKREGRKRRRMKRREERAERVRVAAEVAARGVVVKEEMVVVTWNVQGMSVENLARRKLKMVASYAEKCGWDVVLLSELRASGKGLVWLGQAEKLAVVVHAEKAGVLMRGEALQRWCEGGQRKKWDERHVSVKVQDWVLVATYMPVWSHGREEEIETEREKLLEHVRWAQMSEVLVIGGDFNAHVGGGTGRGGVCGRFGLRQSNAMGDSLIGWCEENGLCWVNSFFSDKKRGTWWSRFTQRWYELDGFVMRAEDRHRYTKKLKTIREGVLSDHRPKKMVLDLSKKKKWRRAFVRKRPPTIRWERLKIEAVEQRFAGVVDAKLRETEGEVRQDSTGWARVTEVVVDAAKEVCGEAVKPVENPWMVGKEEESARLRREVERCLERRGTAVEAGDEEEMEEAREALKVARKKWRKELMRWEKEWWDEELVRCEGASSRGDLGGMYKSLRTLGSRGVKKVKTGTTITKEEFRDHFKKVSEDRFENLPEDMERVVDRAPDLREHEKTKGWRERLGRPPDREEVVREMGKMKDAAPGEDAVRLCFLRKGGDRLTDEVVRIVQFMWVNGSETWEDSLRSGQVVPLYKGKGDRNNPNSYRGVCLLSLGSRIVARIVACRLKDWAEDMGLLDDNQAGFRSGRSTADVTQVMMRMQEDAEDLKKRKEEAGEEGG